MVYPSFVIKDIFIFFNELIKVIFYEKNGITKIRMILLGLKDFIKKRYGKFENIYR
jgi:hypothetical protein